LPIRLSSQYRRVFMSTPKRSKSIETSDFGVKVSILAIRSDWFWFRHEIALKKPTSNQSGESFELVLISLWNCSEKKPTSNQNGESESCKWSNKEVRKSYHRGFAFRLCFPLLLLFVLAPSSSAISCDYFASDSRANGDFWLKTIGKSEISRISDEKNRFPQQKSLGFLPQIWLDPAKSQIRSPTAFLRIWRQMILRKNYGSNLA
jgi:hypothetical protein